jgi:arylamine N-acetyltransferase
MERTICNKGKKRLEPLLLLLLRSGETTSLKNWASHEPSQVHHPDIWVNMEQQWNGNYREENSEKNIWDFKFSRRRVWCSELSCGMYCRVKWLSLMMEAVRTSKTSVDNHFTRQYIPEDNSEHQRKINSQCHFAHLGPPRWEAVV